MRRLPVASVAAVLAMAVPAIALPARATQPQAQAQADSAATPHSSAGAPSSTKPLPERSAALWAYVDGAGIAHVADRPLDSRYVPVLAERAGQERFSRVPGKSQGRTGLLTWLAIAPEVKAMQPWLREAAQATGVDAELLMAVIAVESGYKADAVSPRGAIGLMQLMPATADRYAAPGETRVPAEQRLREPRTNVLTGARMLADLTRRFGGVDLALAAWNAGEGTVRRAGGKMPPIEETQAHVHLVLEIYWALLQQRYQRLATTLNLAGLGAADRP